MLSLKAERLNRGLSLTALAEQIDVPKSTLDRAEQGTEPVPATKLKIAKFYGCAVTDIWPVEVTEKAAA